MKKTNGNMYGFTDSTYNPIRGACSHRCSYCYMIPMRQRFKQDPTLRLEDKELKKSLGKGKYIFVGSSTDEFANDVPAEWIISMLDHLYEHPENTYQLQSKNPRRFLEFLSHPTYAMQSNLIFCTTLESDVDHQVSNAPSMSERAEAMNELSHLGFQTMVTVEPIMAFSSAENFAELIASCNPMQVNIGVNTSRIVKLPEPTKAEFAALVQELQKRNLNVHFKNNIDRMM